MLTDTTFKTLTLAVATYIVFFAYSMTKNPVLECILTILLMVNLSILTYATSQNDFKEIYFRQEIYDDAPMNGDNECECETPRMDEDEDEDEDEDMLETEPEDEQEAEQEQDAPTEQEQEAAMLAATPPWPIMLTPEELAKLNLDLTVNNEPPPFSVRALVRAYDNKAPPNVADLSGGHITPLPPCSHSTDISGSPVDMSDATPVTAMC
jgi:hypothetical protein